MNWAARHQRRGMARAGPQTPGPVLVSRRVCGRRHMSVPWSTEKRSSQTDSKMRYRCVCRPQPPCLAVHMFPGPLGAPTMARYCCLPSFGRCGRSQDRVSVNCPLADQLYPFEWMAGKQFRTDDHSSRHRRDRPKLGRQQYYHNKSTR